MRKKIPGLTLKKVSLKKVSLPSVFRTTIAARRNLSIVSALSLCQRKTHVCILFSRMWSQDVVNGSEIGTGIWEPDKFLHRWEDGRSAGFSYGAEGAQPIDANQMTSGIELAHLCGRR